MIKRLLLGLCLGLAGMTAGCSTNPATGDSSFTAFLSPEEERKAGAAEHPRIVAAHGGAYDYRSQPAYIDRIGRRLVAVSEVKDRPFTFTLLDSDVINAFALPGGFVYVTRGLVALTSSEAELAGVIGHEIAHVVARHGAQRVSQGTLATLGTTLLGVFLGDEAQQAASLGSGALIQTYSREQEFEADLLGIRYLARAGYDPAAAAQFLTKLQAITDYQARKAGEAGEEGFDIMASHPRTTDRIRRAQGEAAKLALKDPVTGSDALLDQIDGMIYGDDPAKGLIRGQRFLFPPLSFKFDVPRGYRLQNGESEVTATGPGQSGLAFDLGQAQPGQSPDAYLRDWGRAVGVTRTQPLTISSKPAATALTEVKTGRSASATLRLVAIAAEDNRVYRFRFIAPAGQADTVDRLAKQVLDRFSPLTPADAKAALVSRVEVLPVTSAADAATLAGRMDFAGPDDRRLFEILNGLKPGEKPAVGSRVKVVR